MIGYTVVRAVDLSPSRRRLEFVYEDGTKRIASISPELDTPEMRDRIADALWQERFRTVTPRGPEPKPSTSPSPWLSS